MARDRQGGSAARGDHLPGKRAGGRDQRPAKEKDEIEAEARKVTRHPYVCREDAEGQARAFLRRHAQALHAIEWGVSEEQVRDKWPPGRPKRDAQPTYHTDYWLRLTVGARKETEVCQERQRRSALVLITTMPSDKADAQDLLMEYKLQGSIERRFAFMKDPERLDPTTR